MNHLLREAILSDIPQLHRIRLSVLENKLSRPDVISNKDYENHIQEFGKTWVYLIEDTPVGFCSINHMAHSIWALFVHPDHENKGIGSLLQKTMLHWHFGQSSEPLGLTTAANTRAEKFYLNSGWICKGSHGLSELKFEMTFESWLNLKDQAKVSKFNFLKI